MQLSSTHAFFRKYLVAGVVVAVAWMMAAWFFSAAYYEKQTVDAIQNEKGLADKQIDNIALGVQRNLVMLHGIPATLARDSLIQETLKRFGADVLPSQLPVEERKKRWSNDPSLGALSRSLAASAKDLGVSILWVGNAAGDCIAASNVGTPGSTIGSNFVDREYYRLVKAGRPGHQFAMGRTTNIPGIFFSAPVMVNGRFMGFVVAKVDMTFFSPWMNQAEAFITDNYGVIILARDRGLEMRAMPNAFIQRIGTAERVNRYKRKDFPELSITPWSDARFPDMKRFDGKNAPFLLASKTLPEDDLVVVTGRPVPQLAEYQRQRQEMFGTLSIIGVLLIVGAVGSLVYLLNITQSRNALAENESKLRGLYELSPLGIALNDMKGHFVEFNEAFRNICGYTEAELKTLDYWTLTPKKYEADELRQLESLERMGRYGPYEKEYIHKDGRSVPLRLNGILIIGHDGQKYIWSIVEDITQQKQDEARMQQLNQTLALQVREEVAKNLEKERLLVQQSRLAAMGEMISNIAHQWRQPINALGLLLANIRDAYEYGELDKAFLDQSFKNGSRLIQNMSTTIDDFRNFFRPTSEMKRFRMCEGVDDAVRLVRDSFRHNHIEIVVDSCDLACFVMGHPNEYSQVVLNALSNAKDAIVSRKTPGKIHIKTEIQGNTSVVFIRDNGGGIPDDVIGRIFDPYFTTKEGGTGIGLYMSKMIMEKMGGDITVRNIEGGVETLISLPVNQGAP